MKIIFVGGGTGGHFYPIIAVTEALHERIKDRKIINPDLYFMSPSKFNPRALYDNELEFINVPAGKVRRYFSLMNFVDVFKTLYGCFIALFKMFSIYPDVVFGKGGYASFPGLMAAKILRIPVIIHESDAKPGRVNAWAGKFAKRVAVSYPEAAKYFNKDKVAFTGNPIRKDIINPLPTGSKEIFAIEDNAPVVLIVGGSQGSQIINDALIEALPELLNRYHVIHQTGKHNIEEIKSTAAIILKDHPYSYRYHPFDYLDVVHMRAAAGCAELVVSRAGSTIHEIAAWGLPSIIIPLNPEVSHDQTLNAITYGKSGAASVIEENNLTSHILIEEIDRIHNNPGIRSAMSERAKSFAHLDSAEKIADAILDIALEHEA